MKNKTAIIIGIYGQDGSYLAEFLIKKNILFMVYLNYLVIIYQKIIEKPMVYLLAQVFFIKIIK